MILRYTGPHEVIQHNGKKLVAGDLIEVGQVDGVAILSRFGRHFEKVEPAKIEPVKPAVKPKKTPTEE